VELEAAAELAVSLVEPAVRAAPALKCQPCLALRLFDQ
jgi:hypothetical protein